MNTLVISYQHPLPEIGGNLIRTMNLVRYFKQFGNVDIAYFQDGADSEGSMQIFRNEFFIDMRSEKNSQSRINAMYERLRYTKPWIVCSFSNEAINELANLVEHGDYAHIVCRYAFSAYPLFFVSIKNKKKVIVDIDDLITPELYETLCGKSPGILNVKSFLDMTLYQLYQKRCTQIGKALVCSEYDKQLLSTNSSADIYVVPNIAPEMTLPASYIHDGFDQLSTILFVGNLGYMPNVIGLKWFIENIFTRLQSENQDLNLLIIGKDPVPLVEEICQDHPGIELVVNPPDVMPYYEKCGVVIVPLLSGGGTRIKILEAGRARRPIITTPIGAYGLSLHDRHELLYMDNYTSFMEQFAWLHDHGNYSMLVDKMGSFVECNFTRKHFESALDKVTGMQVMNPLNQSISGLVSVIVPVYNRENLVGKTIESILAQTYEKVEVIVVNDGSTDGSLDVLKVYGDRYPGKIVIVDQQNTGQVRARNNGIQYSQGEYIAFLDSDDTWEREKLAKQLPLFKGDIGLVYSGINEVDPDGRILNTVPCEQGMRGDIYKQLLIKNRLTGGTVVLSRKALTAVGLFDETFEAAENWDLWIRVARLFEVDFVDEPLLNYLKHPGNMSGNSEKMSCASWAILQKHLPPSARKGELKRTYDQAYANYYYNQAVVNFSKGDYPEARRLIRKCWRYRLLYRDSVVRMVRSLFGKQVNRMFSNCKKRANIMIMQIKGHHDPASC